MRKITKQIKEAWEAGKSLEIDNTRTDGTSIYLHGNEIIRRLDNGGVSVNFQGWVTTTTCERIKNITGVSVYRKQGKLFVNEIEEDGRGWIAV